MSEYVCTKLVNSEYKFPLIVAQLDRHFFHCNYAAKIKHGFLIRRYKSNITCDENAIISCEQALGGRGESSILRYY